VISEQQRNKRAKDPESHRKFVLSAENRLRRCPRLSILFRSSSNAKSEVCRRRPGPNCDRLTELIEMWKRKEDEYTPTPEPSPIGSPSMPVTPAPTRPPEPIVRSSEPLRGGSDVATIGKSVVVKGELSGSEDLIVDGEVEGSISLKGQTLTIGPNGRVRANVEARNVIVHGRLNGDIHATERVELRKTSSLAGDIATARISIDDGAFFKGGIDIQKPEPATKAEVKPQSSAAATPASPATPAPSPKPGQGSLLEPKKF
jgi:cytoskeletal protein CcmA (bactofilin family)